MKLDRLRKGRTVAVIGSIAAIGGGASALAATRGSGERHLERSAAAGFPAAANSAKPLASLTKDELAALARARTAISAASGAIATPILDQAVAAGTITAAQKTAFLASLSVTPGPGSGPDGTWTGATGTAGALGRSPHAVTNSAAQSVFASVQTAIQAKVGSIATPVLDAAVSAATITSAEETMLLSLLESGPIGHPGAAGKPGGMPGPGGPGGGDPPSTSAG
jgi:hypothetical protein